MKSTAKPRPRTRSPILEAVHEGATGLYELGFIDKRRMTEFDAMCLPPIRNYSRTRIVALRRRLQISQSVMASVMNTSVSTVRKWEQGDKQPSGPSLKLLDLLDRKGLEAML